MKNEKAGRGEIKWLGISAMLACLSSFLQVFKMVEHLATGKKWRLFDIITSAILVTLWPILAVLKLYEWRKAVADSKKVK